MKEVLGVQIEKSDEGKVFVKLWAYVNPSVRRVGYVITFFSVFGVAVSYLFR